MNTLRRRRTALLLMTLAAAGVSATVQPAHAMETAAAGDTVEGYLGVSGSGVSRLNRRLEEGLASCMKSEGFEYTPQSSAIPADAADGGVSNRKAFVAKYGYGISTLIQLPAAGKQDPNTAYRTKLSAPDRHSYWIALLGTDPEKGGGAAATPSGFNPKSCIGKTTSTVFGNMASLTALFSKYQDLEKRINANTEVVRAMRDWSACMKKAGFTYAKDADAPADIQKRLGALAPDGGGLGGGIFGGAEAKIDRPGLKKLQGEELATAKVDYECSTKHLGVRDKVAKDLRKTFITENKAALEPLKKVLGGK